MLSQIKFQLYSRAEINKNPELIRKLSTIIREEEQESEYPIPVQGPDYYFTRYSLPVFPNDEQMFIIVESEDKSIAYGSWSSNTKNNSEMAFVFVYVIPEFRGRKISKLVLEQLIDTVPDRVKTIFFPIRSDSITPDYDYRKSLIDYVVSNIGPITFKARRSTSDLTSFKKEEVIIKANELKNQAMLKGFSFELVVDRPDFEKLGFTETEYLTFLESIDNDMPREDASFQDIEINPEMFYYRYDVLKPLNRTRWHYIAIDNKTRKPVGMTEVILSKENPIVVYQGDTGVFHPYRGNKLGLTMKYLMLAEILSNNISKNAKYWTTFNANSNSYMININNELGHKEDAIFYQFEIEKEKFIDLIKQK